MNGGLVPPLRRTPLAVFALALGGLVAAGLYLDRSIREGARRRGAAELQAVAQLKVEDIVDLRQRHERLVESLATAMVAPAPPTKDPAAALLHQAEQLLWSGLASEEGERLALLAPDGRVLAQRATTTALPVPFDDGLIRVADASGAAATSRLTALAEEGRPRLDVAAPVRDATGRLLAVLYLRSDLTAFLASLSRSWPVPSDSGEAVLTRRDGTAALFLSEPRGRTGWSMRQRVPLTEGRRGVVMAAAGREGVFEAIDFLETRILLAVRRVPDSDWVLSTRMDLAEIEAPVVRPLIAALSSLGLLLLLGAGILLAWWSRENRLRRRLALAGRALEESEARLRLALTASSFVWEWDFAVGRLSAEPGWATALAVPEAVPTGTIDEVLACLVDAADLEMVRQEFIAHLRGDTPLVEAEFRVPVAGTDRRWISLRGRVLEWDEAGRPARAIGVMADVTARRLVQEQLESSQRLVGLGTLAAGVAHEINNPLTYVLDAAGTLAEELPAALPERTDLAEAAAHVRDGAERVRDVVRRLRAFSRPAEQPPAPEVASTSDAGPAAEGGHPATAVPGPASAGIVAAGPLERAPQAPEQVPGPAPRVLVVDDDRLVARSIARALGKGFRVATAESAAAALALLERSEPFDVVVCDLMMPEMTGMELHQVVARRAPGLAGRFVFVTGGAFTETSRLFLEKSAAPRIDKPFEPQHLRQVVAEVARLVRA